MLLTVNINEGGYPENETVIKDIQFTVNSGELVGLIGPNGAGKSSTIKGILGILHKFSGNIDIGDYSYIPERPIFYENMTLWEHIDFLFSTVTGQSQDFFSRAEQLIETFRLQKYTHQYPQSFSKGTQQKGMIVLALLKQPDLYIIDEPFMGLDPKATKMLLNQLELEKKRGAGILMSTHVLDTAEKICDRFVLIDEGRLIFEGKLADIRQQSGNTNGDLLDCFDILTDVLTHEH